VTFSVVCVALTNVGVLSFLGDFYVVSALAVMILHVVRRSRHKVIAQQDSALVSLTSHVATTGRCKVSGLQACAP
jgi:hypothetical protein